ncbi:DNA adenine methylase [Jeongeupia chitinilytica]|uniref:site-specific DNA-methyltransferase (adenine-specific) n=1 Tax=Jeongeupia chitinilytica TaxID=1041641 RepID=A0ABQ3H0B2_9NEIS|nr:DNA adenine methylase [Jeongeupia chitinilytica]GHD63906.1 DNA adenine methylase [Jeongeupia chitinilytica]
MDASPIIPWLGGKRRLAEKLFPLFPPHECYVEPFAGGAALFFMRPVPAKTEVLNDINGELVNLYRVVQHHLDEFVRQLGWMPSARQVFKWEQEKAPETLTDIQRAVRFYYLQQHSFGGKVQGQTFGTATTAPTTNLCRVEDNLRAAYRRLAGVYIEHLSWQDVVQRYDRAHTFIYCDPPYWETEGYGVPWDFDNYLQMAEFMRTCKGKVMVSINDHPAIREVFDGFWMEGLDIKYSTGNTHGAPQTSRELVICNWGPTMMGGLF